MTYLSIPELRIIQKLGFRLNWRESARLKEMDLFEKSYARWRQRYLDGRTREQVRLKTRVGRARDALREGGEHEIDRND